MVSINERVYEWNFSGKSMRLVFNNSHFSFSRMFSSRFTGPFSFRWIFIDGRIAEIHKGRWVDGDFNLDNRILFIGNRLERDVPLEDTKGDVLDYKFIDHRHVAFAAKRCNFSYNPRLNQYSILMGLGHFQIRQLAESLQKGIKLGSFDERLLKDVDALRMIRDVTSQIPELWYIKDSRHINQCYFLIYRERFPIEI